MRRNSRNLNALIVMAGCLLVLASPGTAKEKGPPKAVVRVEGLGLFWDREQRQSLERLLGDERGQTLDANAIEDAAFLLMSAITEKGYLKPHVEARMTQADGRTVSVTFDSRLEATVPRPFAATHVEFHVKRGVRYEFTDVRITGLQALPAETAREFFLGEKVLIGRASARAYSPARLQRGLENLESELKRLGFADAVVRADDVRQDDRTGHVSVDVGVVQGARWRVTSLRGERQDGGHDLPPLQKFVGDNWSQFWQQDVAAAIRQYFLKRGYPDVTVRLRREAGEERDGMRAVSVVARVDPGPLVRLGEVRFEGEKRTKESVLRRKVRTQPGELLDVTAMDQARFRLARLSVFDSVNLHFDPPSGPTRDAVFDLKEGRELETNLLFGYGSYEEFRGGVEVRQYNLFGRAHQTRLLLVQSVKSSSGEYSYTVPELFGESVDGTARIFGLQRQETSFLRQEYGGNLSLSAPVRWIGANATLGYTYQSLRNRDNTLTTSSADEKQVTAASVDVTLVRDRRDNPLRPRHGYRWFVQAETASKLFGGSVDYQRLELGGSYHAAWGRGRWVHAGLSHGVLTTVGGSDVDLPVNKRFFPGGDNSIRGYQVGEAAPIGPDGKFLGAKTYTLLNLEIEQALTGKWSVVAFGDGLGTAARLADYPFAEKLYSVGLGIRYQTLIGPLRMEYGRNVNPRPTDPSGTLLFSVGFPF